MAPLGLCRFGKAVSEDSSVWGGGGGGRKGRERERGVAAMGAAFPIQSQGERVGPLLSWDTLSVSSMLCYQGSQVSIWCIRGGGGGGRGAGEDRGGEESLCSPFNCSAFGSQCQLFLSRCPPPPLQEDCLLSRGWAACVEWLFKRATFCLIKQWGPHPCTHL